MKRCRRAAKEMTSVQQRCDEVRSSDISSPIMYVWPISNSLFISMDIFIILLIVGRGGFFFFLSGAGADRGLFICCLGVSTLPSRGLRACSVAPGCQRGGGGIRVLQRLPMASLSANRCPPAVRGSPCNPGMRTAHSRALLPR